MHHRVDAQVISFLRATEPPELACDIWLIIFELILLSAGYVDDSHTTAVTALAGAQLLSSAVKVGFTPETTRHPCENYSAC